MKTVLKSFIFGLIVGAVAGAWPAYNLGRDAPPFSNPFATRTLGTVIKEKAKEAAESAREKLHDITKPER